MEIRHIQYPCSQNEKEIITTFYNEALKNEELSGALLGVFGEGGLILPTSNSEFLLLAFMENTVVGLVKIRQPFSRYMRGCHIFRIGPLYVKESFRNQKIASSLLKEAEVIIRKQFDFPLIKLELSVTSNKTQLHSWYRRIGFQDIGVDHAYLRLNGSVYLDRYLMEKTLSYP